MDVDPIPTPKAPQSPSEMPLPLGMNLRAWLRDILLSLLIATAVVVFLYQPVKVEGTSMLPQLVDEQRIFVNKFVYRLDSIERGDVVVFKLPDDPSRSYIKRVVGLPGETVEVRRGLVYVDGRFIDEEHVPPSYRDYTSYPSVTVPPDEYYVLGDHRNTSKDSRAWGTVSRTYITGKAVFAYWPIERFGTVR